MKIFGGKLTLNNTSQLITSESRINKKQVFDTCLKSDEQHEVAGQIKSNHGGLSLCH